VADSARQRHWCAVRPTPKAGGGLGRKVGLGRTLFRRLTPGQVDLSHAIPDVNR